MNKTKGRKGAEVVEFTMVLLPLLMMIFVLLDVSWGIFVKATLAYAVHEGVRVGVTITGTQAATAGSDLTSMVKTTVQQASLGILRDTTLIKVNYFQPPSPGSTGAPVDVSNQSTGNNPLNIIQVSIQGFSLAPLVPRIFSLFTPVDKSATTINAVAADIIEPTRDPPPIGTAP